MSAMNSLPDESLKIKTKCPDMGIADNDTKSF